MQEQNDNDVEAPASDIHAFDGEREISTMDLQRRGDVEKCPVCGSHVDADAYHCPTCRDYFCYHCRARLLPADAQLQCVNQECDYYGKLVCGLCDAVDEREEAPAVYAEPEDGYWPAWLIIVLVGAAVLWYFYSVAVAAISAVVVFAVGGFLLQRLGLNVFGWERTVEHQRKSSYHVCISCKEPAKKLHQASAP